MKKILNTIAVIAIIILLHHEVNAQADVLSHTRANGYYVGWNNSGTSGTLEIRNDFNSDINLFTNTTQRMTILGSNGNVGIGTTGTPGQRLTVTGGNINISGAAKNYMIDAEPVLFLSLHSLLQRDYEVFKYKTNKNLPCLLTHPRPSLAERGV